MNDLSSGLYNGFLGFGQVVAPGYGAFVTEAVGFRLTADIVAVICFVFAALYFVLAGGPEAFKTTCRKSQEDRRDNDFIRELGAAKDDLDDQVSFRSRKSSSFHMLGPTSPDISRMRLQSTVEEHHIRMQYGLGIQGQGGQTSIETMMQNREKNTTSSRKKRLYSDIDGTPSPNRFGGLNSSINEGTTPTRLRSGGSFFKQACDRP